MNEKCTEFIHELHCRFKIDYIFRQGDSKLFILFSDKEKKSLEELVNRIRKLEYPEFQTVCFFTSRVTELLENGNPGLFRVCQPIHLVYQHPDLNETLSLPLEVDCAASALGTYDREDHKISDIRDNYYHLKQVGSYNLAAFMLHQVLELSYRHAQITLTGKECISHSIREHERFLKRLHPAWEIVFETTDQILLNALEELYRKVRYTDDYQVSPETLDQLEQKMEKVYTQVKAILLYEFTQIAKLANSALVVEPKPQSIALTNLSESSSSEMLTDLEKALTYLNETVAGMLVVYLFGHRQNTLSMDSLMEKSARQQEFYDLLIVTKTDCRDAVNQAQVRLNQEGSTVFLLLAFTQQQVQQALDSNTLFFHQIIQRNQTLLNSDTATWRLHENRGIRTEKEESAAIHSRYTRWFNADSFLRVTYALDGYEDAPVKISLYNQALEQACLGLLEYRWGYKPYKHSLKHLYALCCSLWYFPHVVFPLNVSEWEELLKDWSDMVSTLRYRPKQLQLDAQKVYYYENCCNTFLDEFNKAI
jgi:HEPN domain-containing protein